MLTFIHLSDIHFSAKDDASHFDLNQQIRAALLNDLEALPMRTTGYDALLVSGDVAFSGAKDEYEKAKLFLDDLFARTGLTMKETYMVPGNHDVDRRHVQPTFPLWASHEEIRREKSQVHWLSAIETQVKKDPSQILLAPLRAYNDFAQGCDCQTTGEHLSWQHDFRKRLDDHHIVRLTGLNSALISDAGDAPGKLLVSEFQTSRLRTTPGVVNLIICHHPPDWLLDKPEFLGALDRYAPIALFGHEHIVRVTHVNGRLRLFAGAVQPPRSESVWSPTYHILQLSITGDPAHPKLSVQVHTREFANHHFRAWRDENDRETFECEMDLPAIAPQTSGAATPLAAVSECVVDSATNIPVTQGTNNETSIADAERELRVNFFELPTPQRYESTFNAGLLRDGDDTLDPQVMWAEVFRRASTENKNGVFWEAVAAHLPSMRAKQNPFTTDNNAQTHN